MKFITEDELRQNYKTKPFKTFILSENNRLTPGAKQFLTDFRIKIISSSEDIDEEQDCFTPKYKINDNSIYFNKKLAIELKILSAKIVKLDSIIANKLNNFAVSLYMGIKLPDIKEIERPNSIDKGILLHIEGEHIEIILDVMESILKIEILEEKVAKTFKSKKIEGLGYIQRNMYITKTIKYLLYQVWGEIIEKYGS